MTNPIEPSFAPVKRDGEIQTGGQPDDHGQVTVIIPTSYYDADWETTLRKVIKEWGGYFQLEGYHSSRRLIAKVHPNHLLNDPGVPAVVKEIEMLIDATNSHFVADVMPRRRADYQNQMTAKLAADELQAQMKKAVDDFNNG
ncbi:hypothetical protein AB0362_13175 [Rhodococcus sp. NPDC079359]|uniref:hypothetical protein n=1 Tax=Rhodococcus sp. NPDC079359 TaxID=3154961 RepID=UPI00344D5D43